MKLLEPTLASTPIARPVPSDEQPQGLCLDRGYDFDTVRQLTVEQRLQPHIRTRGEELSEKSRNPGWRASLGTRGMPFLAEPQPGAAHPLVQERREPPPSNAARQRAHRLQEGPRRDHLLR